MSKEREEAESITNQLGTDKEPSKDTRQTRLPGNCDKDPPSEESSHMPCVDQESEIPNSVFQSRTVRQKESGSSK